MPRRLKHLNALPVLAVAVATVAIAGCSVIHDNSYNGSTTQIGSAPYTEGSGAVASETRTVGTFHAVSVENGLTVTISRGTSASARVTADDNLLKMITTTVQDGKLSISVEGSLRTHDTLRVEVTAPAALDSIAQTGGSTVDVEDLAGTSLAVSVDGGSTLRAGGRITNLQLTVAGGSTADLRNVESKTAQVSADGGSTAFVNVTETISGSCNGGSTLKVSGAAGLDAVEKDTGSSVVRD
jgi:hypothetical protein